MLSMLFIQNVMIFIILNDNHCKQEFKKCCFIRFSNYLHPSRCKPRKEILVKRVKIGRRYKLLPRKVFIYCDIVSSLKEMAK